MFQTSNQFESELVRLLSHESQVCPEDLAHRHALRRALLNAPCWANPTPSVWGRVGIGIVWAISGGAVTLCFVGIVFGVLEWNTPHAPESARVAEAPRKSHASPIGPTSPWISSPEEPSTHLSLTPQPRAIQANEPFMRVFSSAILSP